MTKTPKKQRSEVKPVCEWNSCGWPWLAMDSLKAAASNPVWKKTPPSSLLLIAWETITGGSSSDTDGICHVKEARVCVGPSCKRISHMVKPFHACRSPWWGFHRLPVGWEAKKRSLILLWLLWVYLRPSCPGRLRKVTGEVLLARRHWNPPHCKNKSLNTQSHWVEFIKDQEKHLRSLHAELSAPKWNTHACCGPCGCRWVLPHY